MSRFIFTSESVSEGHPDKVCDYISDSVLDACIEQDKHSRVACETLCKSDTVVLAGEITTNARLDFDRIVRQAVREIGYTDPSEPFCDTTLKLVSLITRQSQEIDQGVNASTSQSGDQGAGDQGIMFGYATDESPELMPLPLLLAHKLTKGLSDDRKAGKVAWLRPDSKSQVSVLYDNHTPKEVTAVVVSTQHTPQADQKKITEYVREQLGPRVLGDWWRANVALYVNPTGSFTHGGPSADAGVTGRKIIVDSYGGAGRHGGGAFSGKDPSKVDRSSAYFCRWVAKQVVASGLAKKVEIQVGYAIGMAKPVSVKVDTFGTGDEQAAAEFVMNAFDFRPRAIIDRLDLLRPIYRSTTNYGHFGRPGLPWETVEKAAAVAR
ncbi:MAG: methionine adenosyltransferase [Acidobacteria bacterium RIFCSPLOWO2_02_FULL_68_18]|nr:MAG: methionine adenosyltransferase [Acidobacteria bacterium RIFCSPLOWO2_02_FULL_68_18]OFW50844.1 MAG: methionine adenosyltransferase [Acidobacteria bacterium RIFCSPLOWO2_12_FULL_68_19]